METATAVPGRVRTARARASRGERRREVWMQPPKRANRHTIAEHASNHAIARVFFRSKTVTMLDVRLPPGDVPSPWAESIIDARVFAQDVAAPAIMVAGDHHHGDSGLDEVGKGRHHSKPVARNDRTPLEPELEQVTVDDERRAV